MGGGGGGGIGPPVGGGGGPPTGEVGKFPVLSLSSSDKLVSILPLAI